MKWQQCPADMIAAIITRDMLEVSSIDKVSWFLVQCAVHQTKNHDALNQKCMLNQKMRYLGYFQCIAQLLFLQIPFIITHPIPVPLTEVQQGVLEGAGKALRTSKDDCNLLKLCHCSSPQPNNAALLPNSSSATSRA